MILSVRVVEFIARAFERPRRDVTIVAGHKSRDKRIAVEGLSDAEGARLISAILNRLPHAGSGNGETS